MSFPEVLDQLMKDNNTSNVGLAKAIGVSDMAVARWRKGESSPSLDNAVSISKYYKVTLDQLVSDNKKVESNKFFALPILGEVHGDSVEYNIPNGDRLYTNDKEIDNYPREECYCLKSFKEYLFIHQQSKCENGDYVIYKQDEELTSFGLFLTLYGLRKYVRKDDYIELIPDNPSIEKKIIRKQEINNLIVVGIVINSTKNR